MPELPCRHSSWLPLDQTAYHRRCSTFFVTLQSLAARYRSGRAKVGQRFEARSDKSCRVRKESDEAHRSGPRRRRSLHARPRLLEAAPGRPHHGTADPRASAPDSRHHAGPRPPDPGGAGSGCRSDTRPRFSNPAPDRPSSARADPRAGVLSRFSGSRLSARPRPPRPDRLRRRDRAR